MFFVVNILVLAHTLVCSCFFAHLFKLPFVSFFVACICLQLGLEHSLSDFDLNSFGRFLAWFHLLQRVLLLMITNYLFVTSCYPPFFSILLPLPSFTLTLRCPNHIHLHAHYWSLNLSHLFATTTPFRSLTFNPYSTHFLQSCYLDCHLHLSY